MKLFLVLTTINVPTVLALYRKCSIHTDFIVAGDRKTPREAYEFVLALDKTSVCLPESGHKWKCSETIGFDCLQRRNIGFLEALKAGADVIVTIDDDNIPIATDYFDRYRNVLQKPFDGIKVTGEDGWFDPGSLLIPPTRHRGYPYSRPISKRASPVVGARVGVSAGLIIGDPDIDAVTRMEHRPDIGSVHILGSTGVVVDPHCWTVFNSQNTAVIRELVPAWFMMPGVGRHDDIYASLIVQRVARERGLHVHFGQPFCYQQRNQHDLLADLMAELPGMSNVQKMADLLDSIVLPGKSVIEDTRTIYQTLEHSDWLPDHAIYAAYKWLEDCEGVL